MILSYWKFLCISGATGDIFVELEHKGKLNDTSWLAQNFVNLMSYD